MRATKLIGIGVVALLSQACGGKTGLWDLQASDPASQPAPSPGDSGVPKESGADANPGSDAMPADASDATPLPGCPAKMPSLASECPIEGQICAYKTGKTGPCDDNGTHDQTPWRCEDGRWLEIGRCLEWGECPAEPPADGTPCSTPGLDCFYSRDNCAAESLIQCGGPIWQHVNACKPRSVHECIGLVQAYEVDAVLAPELGKDLSMPVVALAGTQALVAFLRGGGDTPDHDIYATLLQTAVPSMAQTFNAAGFKVGRDAISNPVVAFGRNRFVVAWGANDGWPTGTSGVPGLFARRMMLDEQPGEDVLIDPAGIAPSGLALDLEDGWLGYRIQAPSNDSKYAAIALALGTSEAPDPGTKQIVADETKSEWFAPPVPNALARVAGYAGGFQVAFPAIASGDAWDDSGIIVQFYTGWLHTPAASVRASVGLPDRLSLAALRDGSAIVAFTRPGEGSDPAAPPFHLVHVQQENKYEQLPDPNPDGALLAFGPRIVAAEEGFALVWTTTDPNAPNPSATLHLQLVGPDGSYGSGITRSLAPLSADGRIDVAYGRTDRSLHVVWSPESGMDPQPDRVLYQRWVCGVGIK